MSPAITATGPGVALRVMARRGTVGSGRGGNNRAIATGSRHQRKLPAAAIPIVTIGLAAAAGWWVTSLPPFTVRGTIAVVAIGSAVVAVAVLTRPHRSGSHRDVSRRGLTTWAGVVAVLVTWELAALFQHPRRDHPTISSITDPLQANHAVRWLLFMGWLITGWVIAS